MKKLTLILILFNLILPLSVRGKSLTAQVPQHSCQNTDIREHLKNKSLQEHFTRPRSQDSIGWCYGFAAADLLSAELKTPMSSIHLSALYNHQKNQKEKESFAVKINQYLVGKFKKLEPSSITYQLVSELHNSAPQRSRAHRWLSRFFQDEKIYEGGYVANAINAAVKNKKACQESDLPFDGDYRKSTKDFIERLESIKKDLPQGQVDHEPICLDPSTQQFLPQDFRVNLEEIYSILEESNINKAFAEIVSQHCHGRQVDIPNFNVKTLKRPKAHSKRIRGYRATAQTRIKDYFKTINSTLESGKPLSLTYNIKHVTKNKGLHESLIVARRWKNGRCQYKIRNSWGKGCSIYDTSKIVDCNFEEGAFWVTDQALYEMANRITYIDS